MNLVESYLDSSELRMTRIAEFNVSITDLVIASAFVSQLEEFNIIDDYIYKGYGEQYLFAAIKKPKKYENGHRIPRISTTQEVKFRYILRQVIAEVKLNVYDGATAKITVFFDPQGGKLYFGISGQLQLYNKPFFEVYYLV